MDHYPLLSPSTTQLMDTMDLDHQLPTSTSCHHQPPFMLLIVKFVMWGLWERKRDGFHKEKIWDGEEGVGYGRKIYKCNIKTLFAILQFSRRCIITKT